MRPKDCQHASGTGPGGTLFLVMRRARSRSICESDAATVDQSSSPGTSATRSEPSFSGSLNRMLVTAPNVLRWQIPWTTFSRAPHNALTQPGGTSAASTPVAKVSQPGMSRPRAGSYRSSSRSRPSKSGYGGMSLHRASAASPNTTLRATEANTPAIDPTAAFTSREASTAPWPRPATPTLMPVGTYTASPGSTSSEYVDTAVPCPRGAPLKDIVAAPSTSQRKRLFAARSNSP
mmetsp:Transcript_24629/g.56242  ORF Transcript_24629/g.56242 Transcript_24629/m.56242 type:complete len:234 (-) Transcript_24629:303-1004(-)